MAFVRPRTAQYPAEPSGSTVVFQDSFASGAFTNWGLCQWNAGGSIRNDNCQTYNGTSDYSATVVSDGARPHVARFELRDGDIPFSGTERAEIAEPGAGITDVVAGDERWIAWDMKFDASFPTPVASSGWCVVWQWHGAAAGSSPPLCLDVDTDDVIYLANNDATGFQRTALTSVTRGAWQRWVVHTVFSDNVAVGYAEVWIDGSSVLSKEFRRTMVVADSGNYLKCGIYRDPVNSATAVLSYDNVLITSP